MEDNNNIEDFFNRSLEGFDQSPSSSVWENISSQLDVPIPFWQKYFFHILSCGLAIGMIGMAFYIFSLRTDIESLRIAMDSQEEYEEESMSKDDQLIALNQLNQNLKDELNAGLNSNSELKQEISDLRKEIGILKRNLKTAQVEIYSTQLANIEKVSTGYEASELVSKEHLTAPDEGETEISANDRVLSTGFSTLESKKLESIADLNIKSRSAEEVTNYKRLKFHFPEAFMQRPTFYEQYVPNFKYGVTASLIGTGTDVSSGLFPGYSVGGSLQVELLKHVWLTFDGRYNKNFYVMDFNGSNPEEEVNFPRPRSIDENIRRVDVENSYLDFPMGISCQIPVSKKNSIYINPGFSWQLYLPQQYTYNTAMNDFIPYSESSYVVYFGSLFLNTGVERKISEKMRFQLGFWAEQGLADYGAEDRRIVNYGLKSTLFFQTK